MIKRRLLWLAAIILAGLLWFFDNNAATLCVLLSVVLIPLSGLLFLIGGRNIDLQLRLPKLAKKAEPTSGEIYVENNGILPALCIEFKWNGRNLRTGEELCGGSEISLLPKRHKAVPFSFRSSRCGEIRFNVTQVLLKDGFGLFAKKLPLKRQGSFPVMPELFPMEVILDVDSFSIPDSDVYSPDKPGNDPGECFAIREYVPGNAIRKIHWKLSEKTDKLMVREFGLPIMENVLVLLETAGIRSPDEADAVTEIFASVCAALAERGIQYRAGWRGGKTDVLTLSAVGAEDDFDRVLGQLLSVPNTEGSVAKAFTATYHHCAYSHVIVVGGEIPDGLGQLYNENMVWALLPRGEEASDGLQADGVRVLTFDTETYPQQLARLEV